MLQVFDGVGAGDRLTITTVSRCVGTAGPVGRSDGPVWNCGGGRPGWVTTIAEAPELLFPFGRGLGLGGGPPGRFTSRPRISTGRRSTICTTLVIWTMLV